MTPMIDIVFNLLVFFMLVSEFAKAQTADLELPGPADPPEPPSATGRLVINVTEDGSGGALAVICDGRRYDPRRFVDLLEDQDPRDPTVQVELRADRKLRWEVVAQMMVDCARAGIRKIDFVGEEK